MKALNDLKKCAFCNQKDDGGKEILKLDVPCGEIGTLQAGVDIYDYRESSYPATLHLWMWNDRGGGYGEQLGSEPRIEINYCPFCGKDLRDRLKIASEYADNDTMLEAGA